MLELYASVQAVKRQKIEGAPTHLMFSDHHKTQVSSVNIHSSVIINVYKSTPPGTATVQEGRVESNLGPQAKNQCGHYTSVLLLPFRNFGRFARISNSQAISNIRRLVTKHWHNDTTYTVTHPLPQHTHTKHTLSLPLVTSASTNNGFSFLI